jgi:hypothetical protein
MEEIYRAALDDNSPRNVPIYHPHRAADLSIPA